MEEYFKKRIRTQSKQLPQATVAAKRLVKDYGLDPSLVPGMAAQLRKSMHHGGMSSRVVRYAAGKENQADVGGPGKASLGSTLLTVASKSTYFGPGLQSQLPSPIPVPKKEKKSKEGKAGLVLTKIPPHAVKLTKAKTTTKTTPKTASGNQMTLFDLSEECDCPHKKLSEKIKKKYLKEYLNTVPAGMTLSNLVSKRVSSFSDKTLNEMLGKKVLAETVNGTYYGILGTIKGGLGVFKNGNLESPINSDNLIKIVCENEKYEFQTTTNEFLQEKKIHKGGKFLVTNEAGTKVLGTHESEAEADAQLKAIHANQARHGKLHESSELLYKENIKNKFFVKEEVVNPGNEFTMTNAEIQERDKRAEALLKNPKFKPKQVGNDKTRENSAHRVATYMVMKERGGKGYEPGLFGGEDERKSEKYSRRKTRDLRRLTRGDKAEEKYEKKRRGKRNLEKTAKKIPGKKKERRTFANVKGTKGARFKDAARQRSEKTFKASRYRK